MAAFSSALRRLPIMEKHFDLVALSVKVSLRYLCVHAPLKDTTNTDDRHDQSDNGNVAGGANPDATFAIDCQDQTDGGVLVGEKKASLGSDELENRAPGPMGCSTDELGEGCLRSSNPAACSKQIQSLCNLGEVDKAHKLLNAMMENKVLLKPHLFNAVIVAYAKAGRFKEALKVCNAMQKFGFRPHQTSYHTLMSSYFKRGKVVEALDMFDKMQQDRWQPNEVTRSIVAYGLNRTGHAEQVKAIFQARCGESGSLSTSLCNSLLENFYRSRDWEAAENFGKRIFNGLCQPNVYTYATIIRGRCAQGKLDEAHKLLLEMDRSGLKPNLACYGSLVSGLCKVSRTQEAYELFKDMLDKGIEVEGAFCAVLLNQLCVKGMVGEAMRVCKFLLDKGILVGDTTLVSILEGLSNADRLNEAKPFLESIQKKGLLCSSRVIQQALRALERRGALSKGGDPFRARDPAGKPKSS